MRSATGSDPACPVRAMVIASDGPRAFGHLRSSWTRERTGGRAAGDGDGTARLSRRRSVSRCERHRSSQSLASLFLLFSLVSVLFFTSTSSLSASAISSWVFSTSFLYVPLPFQISYPPSPSPSPPVPLQKAGVLTGDNVRKLFEYAKENQVRSYHLLRLRIQAHHTPSLPSP